MKRLIGLGVVGSGGFAATLTLGPQERALALATYLVFVCALALLGLLGRTGATLPVAEHLLDNGGPRRRAERRQLPQLEWMERQLSGARDSAFELHFRFRPLVCQIASATLARRHGVVLEREQERARRLLGEQLRALLDEEREPPADRFARGLPLEDLRGVIEELEAL
jgi:hypothetical protein